MKQYESYKNSGVEWIGDIPENWKVLPLKRLVKPKITDGPHTTPNFIVEGIPFISAEAIKNNSIDFDSKRGYISLKDHKEYCKKNTPSRDDIFFVKSGSTTGKVAIVDVDLEFSIWSPLALIRAYKELAYSKYLFFFMQSNIFQQQVQLFWSFGTQPNIGMGVIEKLFLTVPSITEQQKIASFLDDKSQKIEKFIKNKQRLIELLEEEKKTLITQAVTKGINPNVSYKNSGVEWIGDIPEHWKVRRLATFGRFSKGSGLPKSDLVENGVPAILYGDIYTKYNTKVVNIISQVSEKSSLTAKEIKKGDILFTGSGETKEDIGKNIVYLGDKKAYAGGDIIIFYQKIYDSLFLSYSLNSSFSVDQKIVSAKGEIIVHIYSSKIKDIYIPIPAIEEQQQIVTYIEKKSQQIDDLKAKYNREIDLINEYKERLIYDAVTGKINVMQE